MGTCGLKQQSEQSSHEGKPEENREQPETYNNTEAYFIAQIVALITHEIYDIAPNVTETLLLTHVFYAESIDLLSAIRDRFFITYEQYKFTTYQRECGTLRYRNTKRPPLNSPSHPHIAACESLSSLSDPINATPISDEMDIRYKSLQRISIDATDLEYIPTETEILDVNEWITDIKMVIQKKCLHLLLMWIQNYWIHDFDENTEIMAFLTQFIKDIKQSRDQFQVDKDTKRKHRNKKKRDKSQQQNYHTIYAAFLIPFILKLDNVIATQQSWYKPIVLKLRNKQELQEKLYNEQIQKSKKHNMNRVNCKAHHRSATNSVSAFSDNIFCDLYDEDIETDSDNDKNVIKNENENILNFISMKNRQNAEEYAKQLTLLDWELFIVINPRMCLYKILSKHHTNKWLSLKLFIDRFQQTHQYVIVSIIAAPDLKARIEMIEFFIFVAEILLQMNNLYSFMAVMTALDSVSIHKLKIAWHLLDNTLKDKYSEYLSPLCSGSNNYKSLRDYTKKMRAPAIPFVALLLKDLTYANDGQQNRLSQELDKHINFNKYMLLYRILSDNLERFHSKSYSHRIKHSKQFESQDIIGIMQQLAVYEESEDSEDKDNEMQDEIQVMHDDDEMDIIPDLELQENILKDFNVYIVLTRDVIRAMTNEANRNDSVKRSQYIMEYKNMHKKVEVHQDKVSTGRKSGISTVIRKLFTNSNATANSSKVLNPLKE